MKMREVHIGLFLLSKLITVSVRMSRLMLLYSRRSKSSKGLIVAIFAGWSICFVVLGVYFQKKSKQIDLLSLLSLLCFVLLILMINFF